MFDNVNNNLIVCVDEAKISNIKSKLPKYNNNCTYLCLLNPKHKFIIEKNECIDKCSNDINYKYEYNNTCYKSCPNGTHISNLKDYLCEEDLSQQYYNFDSTDSIEEITEEYYLNFLNDSNLSTTDIYDIKCQNCSFENMELNSSVPTDLNEGYYKLYYNNSINGSFINCSNESNPGYIIDDNASKPCYPSCNNCMEIGDENNHKCIDCKSNYEFKEEMNGVQNCYLICQNYYYFDEFNNYFCTQTDKCPSDKYNKLIKEKGKCIDNCTKDILHTIEFIISVIIN